LNLASSNVRGKVWGMSDVPQYSNPSHQSTHSNVIRDDVIVAERSNITTLLLLLLLPIILLMLHWPSPVHDSERGYKGVFKGEGAAP